MAQVYKIENKRYEFKEIDSAVVTSYLLTEADYNKWIKLKTDDDSIDLQLPDNLSEGFRCVIENTGVFTVNYVNAAGTSAATQQDKFTEDQFRTVEVVYNNSVWRLQGYIGRQDLSSLYDVNVNAAGLPSDGDVLRYNVNNNQWQAGKNVPYTPSDPFFLDHIITEQDHGQVLLFDTTASPITVSFNLGLEDGLYTRVINIGTGTLTIASAGTLYAAGTTLAQWQGMDVIHAASNIFYGVIFDGVGGSGNSGGSGGGYAPGNYFDTYITTSYAGLLPTTHETTSNSLAIGTQSRSFADNQIVIGSIVTADGENDIAIGHQADCDGTNTGKISIGRLSSSRGEGAIAIGESTTAPSFQSVGIGINANAASPYSIQLGAGTNSEERTLNFRDAKIAHSGGINLRREDAENTVTNTHRFAANASDGGVVQHSGLASFAMSFPNKQLYVGTGTVDNVGQPQKQWVPISSPPNLDYILARITDNVTRENSGAQYYQDGFEQPLWIRDAFGAIDNINKSQWSSLVWLNSTELGNNTNDIIYRRHVQNEPFFRQDVGVDEDKFARWVIQTNVNGLSNSTNGPFSVPAADLTAFSSLLERGDRVLFVGQSDNTQNGIYRYDTFDGNFYIFNRPQDLQLGTAFGTDTVQVWGDNAGEGFWEPDVSVNVGDAITFSYTSLNVDELEGTLYFAVKAPGNYLFNIRLILQALSTPSNQDARAVLTLRQLDQVNDENQIYDRFTFNLYTKDSAGNDDLKDIRLSETIELVKGRYYFTLALYDTPETLIYSQNTSNEEYFTSRIKISPIQLFEAVS